MPKGFDSEEQAIAAAQVATKDHDITSPNITTKEESYGWTVDIDDGNNSLGSIAQNGSLVWYSGGDRCRRQINDKK